MYEDILSRVFRVGGGETTGKRPHQAAIPIQAGTDCGGISSGDSWQQKIRQFYSSGSLFNDDDTEGIDRTHSLGRITESIT